MGWLKAAWQQKYVRLAVVLVAAGLLYVMADRFSDWVDEPAAPKVPSAAYVRRTPVYDPGRPISRPWADPERTAPPPTTYHEFRSRTLEGRAVSYLLYLPPGYDGPGAAATRYPVIYWLHGYGSSPERG